MEQSPQREAHIPSICEGITTPSHGFYETRNFTILSTRPHYLTVSCAC